MLVRGLRRRDPDLLSALIEQYQFRLFRYLLHLTGNRPAAEDLFQETWLRVLERGHQYNGKHKFEAWLFSVARHLVIDSLRKKKMGSLDALMNPESGAAPLQVEAPESSALEDMVEHEETARVAAALASLPAGYREVLVLRFQEGMKIEEIAQVASVPLSTVKSRLYRGIEELKRRLEMNQ